MDPAEAHRVTAGPLPPERDRRHILFPPDVVVADISDRAVRLALLIGWLDTDEPSMDRVAGLLRCSIAEANAAWAELAALRPEHLGLSVGGRHTCYDGGGDW